MSTSADKTSAVSDPASPDYDPDSPHYDVTADNSSDFYVGPIQSDAVSGGDLRSLLSSAVDPLSAVLPEKFVDQLVQALYSDTLSDFRDEAGDGLELRPHGDAPRTLWENASHEQMVEMLSSNADSVAVAETSEEWVQLGNELTTHQEAVADAISDSMGNWSGEGGDAAREHLAEVARWLGGTAQGSVLTGRQQQIHSQTLNETQKQMAANPPVEFSYSKANAELQQITDPHEYVVGVTKALATAEQQQAAREQAARLMRQYDDTIAGSVDMPLFTAPPKLATPQSQAMTTTMVGGAANPAGFGTAQQEGTQAGFGRGNGEGIDSAMVGASGGLTGGQPPGGGLSGSGLPGGAQPGGGLSPDGLSPQPDLQGVPGGTTPGATPFSGNGTGGYTPPATDVPDFQGLPGDGGLPLGTGPEIGDLDVPGSSGTNVSSFTPPDGTQPSRFTPNLSPANFSPPGETALPKFNGTPGPNFTGPGTPDVSGPGASKFTGAGVPAPVTPGRPGAKFGGLGGGAGVPGSGVVPGTTSGGAGAGGGVGGGAAGPGQGVGAGRGPGSGGMNTPVNPAAQPPAGQGGSRGGMPLAGAPAGGGARQAEGDQEHRVAEYLTEDESIFASDEVIAPPVIGDWQNVDWR